MTTFDLSTLKPFFMYGTAWKETETERLVSLALESGFRAIDTANQRRHYHEVGVGAALAKAFSAGTKRQELFLQTKFTFLGGQDHRLPYDPKADYPTQVAQSFQSSLEHLHTDYLDSYVLHGPSVGRGLASADFEVWRAMEELKLAGKVTYLGVSNVSLEQLSALCDFAKVPLTFVQNRCFANRGWDKEVREYCRQKKIIYQGFSLLTANFQVMQQPAFSEIVARIKKTPAQVIFRFAQQVGMLPLTGTSSAQHMQEDLLCSSFKLSPEDLLTIETIG